MDISKKIYYDEDDITLIAFWTDFLLSWEVRKLAFYDARSRFY